jgi:glycosyltransferase involved in cell wall biosynthesis
VRIALSHPTYWPEVRRGSERLIHDLASELAARGHEVTLLTSHRGPSTSGAEDGFRVLRSRRLPQPPTFGLHEDFLGNVHNVASRLIRGSYDLVHAFHLTDAWTGIQAQRLGGPPVVFSFHGMPTRHHLVARRYRLEMLQAVTARAAACCVLSEAAAELFRRYLLRDPRVLPGGVRTRDFSVEVERSPEPTLVCAASIGDPRKRGAMLLEAFAALRERIPAARLEVIRTPDPLLSPFSLSLPEGARWIEVRSTEELASAYARAWASVLTSLDEPFGLVLVESLAAGTPVVAADSGASSEIVTDDRIGRLFEAEDGGDLVRALGEALELGSDGATASGCRERALEFDWSRVVERYEATYAAARATKAAA